MANVLVISPEGKVGGVERFCDLLDQALSRAGHTVRSASPRRQPGRWAMRTASGPVLASASVPFELPGWRPDVVITSGFLGGFRRRGVRAIHVFHGTMVGSALAVGRHRLLRERIRAAVGGGVAEALAARGAVNVAVSESAAEEARRYYRARVARVIANGVDTGIFRQVARADARRALGLAPEARLALFVGRAEPGKGPLIAVETCRRAGFELLVAGDRPISGARHLGLVEPADLSVLYSACDCVLFPTRYEACSYVILEALACGAPVVTTDIGWTQTLLAHVPDYRSLIAPSDPDQLAGVLGRLQEERVLAAVEAASEYVRANNSLDAFGAQWVDLVATVLAGTPESLGKHGAIYAGGTE